MPLMITLLIDVIFFAHDLFIDADIICYARGATMPLMLILLLDAAYDASLIALFCYC